jgi:DNA-binding beta-propeller fold protein YncE
MSVRATSSAFLVMLLAALACVPVLSGCGTSGTGATTPASGGAATVADPTGSPQGSRGVVGESPTGATTPAPTVDRAEIERRLALPRFTYVGESDRQGTATSTGALAFIDSEKDTLAFRPRLGDALGSVAVAPDGRLVYVTDNDAPVLWVVDAETHEKVRGIRLPGVAPSRLGRASATGKYTYAQLQSCSSAVACTPDGALVLVLTTAGLQVIDTASAEVVRTLPELRDGMALAVSFDGKRAFISTTDAFARGKHTILDWREMTISGLGGGLALLDLETWQIGKRVSCGVVGGIAVDPDDSRIFCSDYKLKALRIVDPVTLADIAVAPLKSAKLKDFLPVGVGVLPDGSKAYVVCTAANSSDPATASRQGLLEFFCAVVETKSQEVVKRIPLGAY